MAKNIEFEHGSGNVFTDLHINEGEELEARGLIGLHLITLLKEKDMKQREITDLLGIKQAEVSHLLNGHFSRFSVDKLLEFLKCLNQKVTIQISPRGKGEPYHHVALRG